MVKVFPNSFSFIEKQRLLTSVPGEPVAITCSNECVFVAEEGCLLEVFSLNTLKLMGQVRTVSPVRDLVYNAKGDCIVTLERKGGLSLGFARVYFKWRGATVDQPMRISLLNSFSSPKALRRSQDHIAAEIIELPGELNSQITCLSCCAESGRIAVGMDTTLRIFTLSVDYEGKGGVSSSEGSEVSHDSSALSYSIDMLLDIHTSTNLHKLSIFNDYIAFISTHEVRVIKLSLLRDTELQTQQLPFVLTVDDSCTTSSSSSPSASPSGPPRHAAPPTQRQTDSILEDKNFVKWSPSRVWEEEKAANISTSSSLVDVSLSINKSHDSRGPSPIIGTLSLPSVYNSTAHKQSDDHAVEVLGPVEYIWGQPIRVQLEQDTQLNHTQCRVLTMLYRRFTPKSRMGEPLHRSMSLPVRESGRVQEDGLHTVQLLPVIITDDEGCRQLLGISCFLANKFHGYLYDVHLQGHPASSFSFMSPTHTVVCDDMFLHALSAKSVESYTSRSLQAAILHMSSQQVVMANSDWLHKPCPSPKMDLTLISANQFVSCCCLASSRHHMVVVTKSAESPATSWLASLAQRKSSESNWNIYILQKKGTAAMYHEFNELSGSLQGSSPPMYHHMLCEGHTLLRSQLLLNPTLSKHQASELLSCLHDSCMAMAESLCNYNTAKSDLNSAAKYLVLSRHSIWSILQTFSTKFQRKPSSAYTILIKFLELVLYDQELCDDSMSGSEPADTVLQLYADFHPQLLPQVLLNSWLETYFTPGKALQVMTAYLQIKSLDANQIFLGRLCEMLYLLRLHEKQKAVVKLRQLTDTFFVDWLGNNLTYLIESNCQLTPLGRLLLENRVGCLLCVFNHSLDCGTLELELIYKLLQGGGSDGVDKNELLAMNLPLKHFLDGLFLDKVPSLSTAAMQKAQMYLVDVLLARLIVAMTPPSSSTPFLLYGSRHKWLDSLPPFDSSSPTKQSQVALQDLMQLQAILCNGNTTKQRAHVPSLSSHMTSHSGHMTSHSGHMTSHSSHMTSQHMIGVATHLEGRVVGGMVGELSLLLLTWPHTGKIEQAVQRVFQEKPILTVEYCETFLPPQLKHWERLLTMLLASCSSPSPDHTHLTLYRAALSHAVGFCSPEEFLHVLPPTGSLSFFIPYIEKSCKLELSRHLAHQLSHSTS